MVFDVKLFFYSVLIIFCKLIEDLNFFRKVFKTLGFFCRFLTINLLFYLVVLFLLVLLCSMWSRILLGFVLLGCMCLQLVGIQFMLVGLLCLLLFRIVLCWLD